SRAPGAGVPGGYCVLGTPRHAAHYNPGIRRSRLFDSLKRVRWSVFGLALLCASLADAQDWKGSGRVEGRVLAPDGTPVVGATLKLVHTERKGGPTIKTDKKGRWAFLGLVAGTWNVDVEAAGYATAHVSVNLATEASHIS